jgi:hypothetical protein
LHNTTAGSKEFNEVLKLLGIDIKSNLVGVLREGSSSLRSLLLEVNKFGHVYNAKSISVSEKISGIIAKLKDLYNILRVKVFKHVVEGIGRLAGLLDSFLDKYSVNIIRYFNYISNIIGAFFNFFVEYIIGLIKNPYKYLNILYKGFKILYDGVLNYILQKGELLKAWVVALTMYILRLIKLFFSFLYDFVIYEVIKIGLKVYKFITVLLPKIIHTITLQFISMAYSIYNISIKLLNKVFSVFKVTFKRIKDHGLSVAVSGFNSLNNLLLVYKNKLNKDINFTDIFNETIKPIGLKFDFSDTLLGLGTKLQQVIEGTPLQNKLENILNAFKFDNIKVGIDNIKGLKHALEFGLSKEIDKAQEKAKAFSVNLLEPLGNINQVFMGIYDLSKKKMKEFFYMEKATALAQAVIRSAGAVLKALEQGGIWGVVQAASIASLGAVQVAKIGAATLGYKHGGYVDGEDGEDRIPALLTKGEFVIPKLSVTKYGLDILEKIRTRTLPVPRYSQGGLVNDIISISHTVKNATDSPSFKSSEKNEFNIMNFIDPSVMESYLASSMGQNAIINIIKNNPISVKEALNVL